MYCSCLTFSIKGNNISGVMVSVLTSSGVMVSMLASSGVMVSVLASRRVVSWFKPRSCQTKTRKLVFVASLLSMQH